MDTEALNASLKTAQEALADGRYHVAKELYQMMLDKNSEDPKALHGLGLVYITEKQYERAYRYLKRAYQHERHDPMLLMHLGNAARILKDLENAEFFYKEAATLNPRYAEAYAGLGSVYELKHEIEHAIEQYNRALSYEPLLIEAHYNLGRVLLMQGEFKKAEFQFKSILHQVPAHIQSRFHMGLIKYNEENWLSAKNYFLEVLQLAPQDVETLNNLGVISLKLADLQQAVSFFGQVIAYQPDHIEGRENIAAAFMQANRFDNAIIHYEELLRLEPNHSQGKFNLACAYMAIGELHKARQHFEALLKISPDNIDVFANLGLIAQQQSDSTQAAYFYGKVLEARPDDPVITHMNDALRGMQKETMPEAYVKHLFDHYAFYYDKHLRQTLSYSVPEKIQKCLKQHQVYFECGVDLGCGTGLAGEMAKPFGRWMLGIDISEKMVEEARKKFIYDELVCSDLITYFSQSNLLFDFVLAADVFNYIGDLAQVMEAVYAHLLPRGYLIFTYEATPQSHYVLEKSGRFSHHVDYIHQVVHEAGFILECAESLVLRMQNKTAVEGAIVLARKPL